MANLMGILGGVGQGISGGVQDLERMDKAKYLKEQQDRERAKWAEEDARTKELAGIPRENVDTTYEGATGGIDGESSRVIRTPRAAHEILSDSAKVYLKGNPESMAKGMQFQQAARAEKLATTEDKLNEDYDMWADAAQRGDLGGIAKGMALFNSNKFGPASTKDVTVTPIAGNKGDIMYQVNRPGQGPMILPQQGLVQAIQAMKLEALASANPAKYGELSIKRQAGDTDRMSKLGMLDVYKERNALDAKELAAKAGLWGAQTDAARQGLQGFQSIISQDEDGKIYGIKKNGEIGTMQGPMGRDGKPVPLFPKTTGAKAGAREADEADWSKIELELIKQGEKDKFINTQKDAFLSRRAADRTRREAEASKRFAPPGAEEGLRKGVTASGKKLTEADVDEYNRLYPNSKVDKSKLTWLGK